MTDTTYEPADIDIYIRDKGLVLREKSLIAYSEADGRILAIGTAAEQIAEENRAGTVVSSPLRQGRIADYHAAEKMFRYMLAQAWGKRLLGKPVIVVGIAEKITDVEKKALTDMVFQLGAKDAVVFEGDHAAFLREIESHSLKQFEKYQIFIGITKYEPERYITEELSHIRLYAEQQGISLERVKELL